MSENLTLEHLETPQKRGERLRIARKMTKLSREDFQNKYGIKAGSIRSWEAGWKTGLSEKGARSMIVALMREGVQCSIGWLLYGSGSAPRLICREKVDELSISSLLEDVEKIEYQDVYSAQHLIIREELAVYEKNHPNAITFVIKDDGMEPSFSMGDYVAGNRRYGDEIHSLIGSPCIVETQMGEILLRQLRKGSIPDTYSLACLNMHTELKAPYLYDVELVSAAPVVWHRKKDKVDFD